MSEEHIAIILRIGEHTKFIPDHSITSEKTLNKDYCCWVVISCRRLFIDCLTLFLGGVVKVQFRNHTSVLVL